MLHQVHHSIPQFDILSSVMTHPLDLIVSPTLSVFVSAFLLGFDARVVAIIGVLDFFITLFPHWNVRTPSWVGYFIQRPEEHILHHQREVHADNYSDWPLWDKVFGTYRAPVEEPVQVGFARAGFAEQLKMLGFYRYQRGRLRQSGAYRKYIQSEQRVLAKLAKKFFKKGAGIYFKSARPWPSKM